MSTTFRTDLVAGLVTMTQAFIAANPTLLRRVFTTRPPSFTTDLPCAYVDLRPEEVTFDAGTRTRTISPSIVLVDMLADSAETYSRMDTLVDAFLEHVTGYPHVVPGSVWNRLTLSDEAEENGDGTLMASVRFAFPAVSMQDGRL